jgi:hypothetical protein
MEKITDRTSSLQLGGGEGTPQEAMVSAVVVPRAVFTADRRIPCSLGGLRLDGCGVLGEGGQPVGDVGGEFQRGHVDLI